MQQQDAVAEEVMQTFTVHAFVHEQRQQQVDIQCVQQAKEGNSS